MSTRAFRSNEASLYIGDLHPEVTESMLLKRFEAIGNILSIRVCRDRITQQSLGYGYINFHQLVDAERALDTMNFEDMKGIPMRIMWYQRDPNLRRSGVGNIFIKNLDKTIDSKSMYDTFSAFGNILSCKVACDENGSKGYGFVHFDTLESAQKAIDSLNGMILSNQKVFIGHFKSRQERVPELARFVFTNLYIKNFGKNMDDVRLKEMFTKFGPILSVKVIADDNGKSKGFGFVNFEKHEDALRATDEMNGQEVNGKTIYVARAQKKSERKVELKRKFEQIKLSRIARSQGVNLYIKNLADCIDDRQLHRTFCSYGTITSAKVMMNGKRSKGFGFVCFSSPDEAAKAVTEMNGRIVASKPLYVALAQRKKERLALLTNHFRQRRNHIQMVPDPVINTYQPCPPNYLMAPVPQAQNHAAYYSAGQIPQAVPNPTWTTQAFQNIPKSIRLNAPSLTTYDALRPASFAPHMTSVQHFANIAQPGIESHPSHFAAAAASVSAVYSAPQYQYSAPILNQQQLIIQPQVSIQQQPTILPLEPSTISMPAAPPPPVDQKQILGERLFPLIQVIHPTLARKITGMLLELDNSKVLHMLESPEFLRSTVSEALAVLQDHQAKEVVHQVLNNAVVMAAV